MYLIYDKKNNYIQIGFTPFLDLNLSHGIILSKEIINEFNNNKDKNIYFKKSQFIFIEEEISWKTKKCHQLDFRKKIKSILFQNIIKNFIKSIFFTQKYKGYFRFLFIGISILISTKELLYENIFYEINLIENNKKMSIHDFKKNILRSHFSEYIHYAKLSEFSGILPSIIPGNKYYILPLTNEKLPQEKKYNGLLYSHFKKAYTIKP